VSVYYTLTREGHIKIGYTGGDNTEKRAEKYGGTMLARGSAEMSSRASRRR